MAKKEYPEGSFGAYFVELIRDHGFSQVEFAASLGISKTYLIDVFNCRQKPPTPDMQDRIISLLKLEGAEKIEFYDKAAADRKELPKDIVDYLSRNPAEVDTLRSKILLAESPSMEGGDEHG